MEPCRGSKYSWSFGWHEREPWEAALNGVGVLLHRYSGQQDLGPPFEVALLVPSSTASVASIAFASASSGSSAVTFEAELGLQE